ncbi:MAG: TIGR04053 family radical SAM/SPASM domain-containing protein, partial [Actinomycetes bacterium]
TLACGLSCRHCRATAVPDRSPTELSTAEGLKLLDEIKGFGEPLPHIVFTGGDPLRREDLEELVVAATERGIGASLAPAVTPDMTFERLQTLRDSGVQAMSLSLDGSTPELHDGLRGVPGTFELTMQAETWMAELGIPIQVNTLVTDKTLADLPAIYDLLATKTVMRWSLFFLISIGRGSALKEITPGESEKLFHWLYNKSKDSPFMIKTTEAMHYRRVAIREMEREGMSAEQIASSSVGRGFGIRDGNGILFISNEGTVYPSGFLPVPVGNVRSENIVELYRNHPTFTSIRNISQYKGRCGICQYADRCGGSRARAFAWTGDILETDPLCPFHPH